ncbi:MAG: 6-phosphofructokinase, partial [Planctomycetota bacterium]
GTGALGDFLAEYVKSKLQSRARGAPRLRIRADTYGYLQRSFAGYASPVDQAEARLAGRTAVKLAMSGDIDGSVVFKRKKAGKYGVECVRAELSQVARETKHMPRSWINKAGNDVTKPFLDYARPLVGELPALGQLR